MIQQSPTERAGLVARLNDAREVFDSLSIYVSEGSLAALEIEQSQASIDAALSYLASQAAQPAEADGVDLTGLRGVAKLARLMAWHHFGVRWDHLEKVSRQEITAACQAAFDWMNRPLPERQSALAAAAKAPATDAGEVEALVTGITLRSLVDDPRHLQVVAHFANGSEVELINSYFADGPVYHWAALATPPAPNDDLRAENERLRKIVQVVADADSEDAIGSLDIDIPSGGYPRQWLRDAARAALKENRRG